ncbi:TPA: phytanoyl-CoA dioxygenase [Vibrio vulnificus]|uniref:phytanoyl-CoA dioxygenase family protein n=1 Tax=Vibrio vulnificus TaxID=672 RepID=UPI00165EBC18|nr:phytanoyl-CoA dioxygenase family protein [Vibrio vulnificus]EGR9007450.1 phytanoyl-CoA dioxygenase [Vibrio vulnificus]EHU9457115.1 phytanoyl-CoA dioxygenase family protein [Vibrio vulnificus]HAS6067128.1 phytanoyl-CoA dioxygenase [Vibrio vulnificus]HAS6191010.1 phytanoyl-CoA dioxygenase [Vibrio vulnificus]HAS8256517.1 phytanoyl-CoA dioxygenase [Vibrio vulnificus]
MMKISISDVDSYNDNGYLVKGSVFSEKEIDEIYSEINKISSDESLPGRVLESDGSSVRSLNGPHLSSDYFAQLGAKKLLVDAAKRLLGEEDIYIHQYKINTKKAFSGEKWEWHSDYWFWNKEDGMPSANSLTVGILLDDMTAFNGPLMVIPGTHVDELTDDLHQNSYNGLTGGKNWEITTSSKLKYQLSTEYLKERVEKSSIVALEAQRGSVIIFHSNILHASSYNISPWDRGILLVSYNTVSNRLNDVKEPRPEFMATRNVVVL